MSTNIFFLEEYSNIGKDIKSFDEWFEKKKKNDDDENTEFNQISPLIKDLIESHSEFFVATDLKTSIVKDYNKKYSESISLMKKNFIPYCKAIIDINKDNDIPIKINSRFLDIITTSSIYYYNHFENSYNSNGEACFPVTKNKMYTEVFYLNILHKNFFREKILKLIVNTFNISKSSNSNEKDTIFDNVYKFFDMKSMITEYDFKLNYILDSLYEYSSKKDIYSDSNDEFFTGVSHGKDFESNYYLYDLKPLRSHSVEIQLSKDKNCKFHLSVIPFGINLKKCGLNSFEEYFVVYKDLNEIKKLNLSKECNIDNAFFSSRCVYIEDINSIVCFSSSSSNLYEHVNDITKAYVEKSLIDNFKIGIKNIDAMNHGIIKKENYLPVESILNTEFTKQVLDSIYYNNKLIEYYFKFIYNSFNACLDTSLGKELKKRVKNDDKLDYKSLSTISSKNDIPNFISIFDKEKIIEKLITYRNKENCGDDYYGKSNGTIKIQKFDIKHTAARNWSYDEGKFDSNAPDFSRSLIEKFYIFSAYSNLHPSLVKSMKENNDKILNNSSIEISFDCESLGKFDSNLAEKIYISKEFLEPYNSIIYFIAIYNCKNNRVLIPNRYDWDDVEMSSKLEKLVYNIINNLM